MGLAATQVRLLQLTSRQHSIEYQAQKLQAQKLQLANDSDRAYNAYMTALDAKKIQYKYVETDGSITYKDATFNNMCTYGVGNAQTQYAIEIINGEDKGKFYVANTTIEQAFEGNQDWEDVTVAQVNQEFNTEFGNEDINTEEFKTYQKKYKAVEFSDSIIGAVSTDNDARTYYQNLYLVLIEGSGVKVFDPQDQGYGDSYEWLTNMISNGDILLHKYDVQAGDDFTGGWIENSVSTDSNLDEIADEKELKKAEATYEAETARINRKDAQYDTLLSQTETERTAIKTEMDDLKKVSQDNVDKTFKLFS